MTLGNVVSMPALIDPMPFVEREAWMLNAMDPVERAYVLAMSKDLEEKLDRAFLYGDGV